MAAGLRATDFFAGGRADFFAAGFFGAGLDLAGDFRTGFASFLAMVILTGRGIPISLRGGDRETLTS